MKFSIGKVSESPSGLYLAGIVHFDDRQLVEDALATVRASTMFQSVHSLHSAYRTVGNVGFKDEDESFKLGEKLLILLTKLDVQRVILFVARWVDNDVKGSLEVALAATQDLLERSDGVALKEKRVQPVTIPPHFARPVDDSIISSLEPGFLSSLCMMQRPNDTVKRICTCLAIMLEGRPLPLGWSQARDVLKKTEDIEVAMLLWSPKNATGPALTSAAATIKGIDNQLAERVHQGCSLILQWLITNLQRSGYMQAESTTRAQKIPLKHAIFSAEGIVSINPNQRVRPRLPREPPKKVAKAPQVDLLEALRLKQIEEEVIVRERLPRMSFNK